MSTDPQVQAYRLLDAVYGQVEASNRLLHETRMLRSAVIQSRRLSVQSAFGLVVLTVAGALATLYALVPEAKRGTPTIVIGICGLLYVAYLVWSWFQIRSESTELSDLLPPEELSSVDTQPEFILLQVSAYGSRLSAARSILATTQDTGTKRKFEAVAKYYAKALDDIRVDVNLAIKNGAIDAESASEILEWLDESVR